ncbi:MAG: class I SAM-dependent methyltransferase [Candidatus Binataceae bacterium]
MSTQEQTLVNRHFEKVAPYWMQVYGRSDDLYSQIYQERLRIVLEFADRTGLPKAARALDIGCGAGYATVALARRGYRVDAVDAVEAMTESTRHLAAQADLRQNVKVSRGDIHALPFPDKTFDLVVAVGVLPWLTSVEEALNDISLILQPRGYLIATVDNRWGLRQLVEPLANPLFAPLKGPTKTILRRFQLLRTSPRPSRTSIVRFDSILADKGFDKLGGITIGFGPFTFFRRQLLPNRLGIRVNDFLQAMAYRAVPGVAACGAEYVFLARKTIGG